MHMHIVLKVGIYKNIIGSIQQHLVLHVDLVLHKVPTKVILDLV